MNPDQNFCSIPFSAFAPVEGNTFIHDLLTDRFIRLTEAELNFLYALSSFRSKVDHFETWKAEGITTGDERQLAALWNTLDKKKLLYSAREFLNHLQTDQTRTEQTPVTLIACPTADRAEFVIRMIKDYLELAGSGNKPPSFLLCDYSKSPASTTRLQDFLATQTEPVVQHVTRARAYNLTEELGSALRLDEDEKKVLRFGILGEGVEGPAYGAGRNLLLLLTAGRRFLFTDDDVRPWPAYCGDSSKTDLTLHAEASSGTINYFPDRATMLNALQKTTVDLFASHGSWLGVPLGQLTDQFQDNIKLSYCRRTFLYDLIKRQRKVLITQTGVYGDCGFASPNNFFFLDQSKHQTSLENHGRYDRLKISREIVKHVDAPTICRGPFFMGLHAGVDNSGLLPPFPPHFRSEDSVWGLLVSIVRPEALFAHAPFALLHDPASRQFSPQDFGIFSLRVSDYLLAVIEHFCINPGEQTPGQIIRDLGLHLMNFGKMRKDDFIDSMTAILIKRINPYFAGLVGIMQSSTGNRSWWKKDLSRYLENIHLCQTGPNLLIPAEWQAAVKPPLPLERLQEYLRLFGQFMTMWPDLVAHCAAMDVKPV